MCVSCCFTPWPARLLLGDPVWVQCLEALSLVDPSFTPRSFRPESVLVQRAEGGPRLVLSALLRQSSDGSRCRAAVSSTNPIGWFKPQEEELKAWGSKVCSVLCRRQSSPLLVYHCIRLRSNLFPNSLLLFVMCVQVRCFSTKASGCGLYGLVVYRLNKRYNVLMAEFYPLGLCFKLILQSNLCRNVKAYPP